MNIEELVAYCNNPERDAGNQTAQYATQFANSAMSADYRFVIYRRYQGADLVEESITLIPTALVATFEEGTDAVKKNMVNVSMLATEAALNDPAQNSFIYWFNNLYS